MDITIKNNGISAISPLPKPEEKQALFSPRMVSFSELLYEQSKLQESVQTPPVASPKTEIFSYLEKVNALQNDVSVLARKFIVDPDSIQVHDISIAMSKADVALDIAKDVINHALTAWEKITSPTL